jgi:hypothetical protein
MQLSLLHFSGYGFGRASPTDPGRIHLLYASAHAKRLEAQLAKAVEAKAKLLGGRGEIDMAAFVELARPLLIEYYDGVVAPTMKIAETDDRMAQCARSFYFGWLRQLQLLDVAGTRVGMIDADAERDLAASGNASDLERRMAQGSASAARIMAKAAAGMMKRAQEGCRRHDLSAFARVVGVYRQFQLLGVEETPDMPGVFEDLKRMKAECFRWEVELVSGVESRLPSGASRFQLASTAQFNAADGGTDAPLNYRTLEVSGRPMKDMLDAMSDGVGDALLDKRSVFRMTDFTISKRGSRHGTVRVLDVHWVSRPDTATATNCAGSDEVQDILVTDSMQVTLRIDPPTEIVRFTPSIGGVPPHDAEMHEWIRFFTQFRDLAGDDVGFEDGAARTGQPEQQEKPQVLTVKVKQQEPGVWRAEFNTKEGAMGGSEGLSETGHLVLRHTPK